MSDEKYVYWFNNKTKRFVEGQIYKLETTCYGGAKVKILKPDCNVSIWSSQFVKETQVFVEFLQDCNTSYYKVPKGEKRFLSHYYFGNRIKPSKINKLIEDLKI